MPYLEVEMDLEHMSIPLAPLLTTLFRINILCLLFTISVFLLALVIIGCVWSTRGHAALLELKVGQDKLLEALRAGPGAPRAAGCPDAD